METDNIKIPSVSNTLKRFISKHIPTKVTNILFQLFNGIQAMFQNLEYRIKINERESNILTAQHLSSLRNLAAQNGFEPTLKQAASGMLLIHCHQKLFNRVGYPLYIRPNTVFVNKVTKLNYVYTHNKTIKITAADTFIPVTEGIIMEKVFQIDSDTKPNSIVRLYLESENIAEGSILVEVNGIKFQQVKSFYDNIDRYDNKQYLLKFGADAQKPIALYLKGVQPNETVVITYMECNGSYGNLKKRAKFETDSLLDSLGSIISYSDEEVEITSISGFQLGSDGTDENALRAAIGYNHGFQTIFDAVSYRNFLSKYNTICIQAIAIPRKTKQINHIYLWNKPQLNYDNIVTSYLQAIHNKTYLLDINSLQTFDKLLEDNEYCLSSHVLHQAFTQKYAIQVMFENKNEMYTYKDEIEKILYSEFAKFLQYRFHQINLNTLFDTYKKENNINFDCLLLTEAGKQNTNNLVLDNVVSHQILFDNTLYLEDIDTIQKLPILDNTFEITSKESQANESNPSKFKLSAPIAFVVESDALKEFQAL